MTARATSDPRHHGNRHGRSEQARIAVLEAADDLLAERGFAGVTIEGIAARAGVAKQTIYRWWDSKTAILFDALAQDAEEFFTAADTGDLGSDLRVRLREVATFLTTTDAGAVARALAGQAQHDPAVAARFAADFTSRQRALDRAPFLRARAVVTSPLAPISTLPSTSLPGRCTTGSWSPGSPSRRRSPTPSSMPSWLVAAQPRDRPDSLTPWRCISAHYVRHVH